MSRDRSKVLWTDIVYLLQSRRRQAVVFGPPQIALILGLVFGLGALLGGLSLTITPLNLIAIMLSVIALVNGWQAQNQPERTPAVSRALLGLGVLLVGGALLLAAGIEVTLLWSALLIAFALVLIILA